MKGQFTIISLIMVFVIIVFFSALYPTLALVIENFLAISNDSLTNTMISLIPFFIVLAIVLTIIFYIYPHRE